MLSDAMSKQLDEPKREPFHWMFGFNKPVLFKKKSVGGRNRVYVQVCAKFKKIYI